MKVPLGPNDPHAKELLRHVKVTWIYKQQPAQTVRKRYRSSIRIRPRVGIRI